MVISRPVRSASFRNRYSFNPSRIVTRIPGLHGDRDDLLAKQSTYLASFSSPPFHLFLLHSTTSRFTSPRLYPPFLFPPTIFFFFFSIPLTFHFCPFLSFPCSNLCIPLYRFLWLFSNHYILLFIVLFCSLCAIALFIFFIFFFPPNSHFLLYFCSIVLLYFSTFFSLSMFLPIFWIFVRFLFLFLASSSSSFFLSVFLRYFSFLLLSFSSGLLLHSSLSLFPRFFPSFLQPPIS